MRTPGDSLSRTGFRCGKRIPAGDLTQLLLPSFDPASKKKATTLTRGIPASPGAATGKLAFTAHEAVERARAGEKVLLRTIHYNLAAGFFTKLALADAIDQFAEL